MEYRLLKEKVPRILMTLFIHGTEEEDDLLKATTEKVKSSLNKHCESIRSFFHGKSIKAPLLSYAVYFSCPEPEIEKVEEILESILKPSS